MGRTFNLTGDPHDDLPVEQQDLLRSIADTLVPMGVQSITFTDDTQVPAAPETVMGVEVDTLRDMIKRSLGDCIGANFFYYDRKGDEELTVDLLRAALETRTVTLDEMLEWVREIFVNANVQPRWDAPDKTITWLNAGEYTRADLESLLSNVSVWKEA